MSVCRERPGCSVRLRLFLPAAVLALAAAACGGGAGEEPSNGELPAPPAAAAEPAPASSAPAGGAEEEPTTVTQAAVRLGWGEVAVIDGEPVAFDDVAALTPDSGDVVDPQTFAQSLLAVITNRVLAAAAEEDFGLVVTDAAVEAKREELIAFTGLSEEEVLEEYGLTAVSLRLISAGEAVRESVQSVLAARAPAPSEEELRVRYEAGMPAAALVCSAHILLESREEAEAALGRAQAGEDFAALARELSTGPSGPNGGDLGCGPPSQYVEEFAAGALDAEVGVPYGPVETQFGWHVILVSDRTIPSFEEMRSALAAEMQDESAGQSWEDWALGALAAADVQVEPEYGEWTTDPIPNVTPPSL